VIDLVEPIRLWVNTYISNATVAGDDFLEEINRLYGIGAALDPAGVRFSIVLVGLSALVARDPEIRRNKKYIFFYVVAFFIISIVGNMIARTTVVGMVMGGIYMLYSIHFFKREVKKETVNVWSMLLVATGIIVIVATWFYNNDTYMYKLFRFGFEGFFNWIETGNWTTASTTKMNAIMWIWPVDTKAWIIGTGIFRHMGTDIGYCRFVLYSGLCGLIVFSLFFVYNAIACMHKFPHYRLFFFMLLLLSFIIWVKVATDLFLIYALFYCIDDPQTERI
jgi:hypothetical protein